MIDDHKARPAFALLTAFTVGLSLHLLKIGWQILMPGSIPNEAASSVWIYWLFVWFVVGYEFARRNLRRAILPGLTAFMLVGLSAASLAVTLLMPSLERARLMVAAASASPGLVEVTSGGLAGAIFFVPGFLMGGLTALGLNASSRRWYVSTSLVSYAAAPLLSGVLLKTLNASQMCFIVSLLPAIVGIAGWAGRTKTQPASVLSFSESNLAQALGTFIMGACYTSAILIWLKLHFFIGTSTFSTHCIGISSAAFGVAVGSIIGTAARLETRLKAGIAILATPAVLGLLALTWQVLAQGLLSDLGLALAISFLPALLAGFALEVVTGLAVANTRANAIIAIAIAGSLTGAIVSGFLPYDGITLTHLIGWLPLGCFIGALLWLGRGGLGVIMSIVGAGVAIFLIAAGFGQPEWDKLVTSGARLHANEPQVD
ncbi:MAG TPA: hypothetical protein ENI46_03890, partial [Firmicutes bacterium]|nr:hypothetical protein [Bacillota bacterium]